MLSRTAVDTERALGGIPGAGFDLSSKLPRKGRSEEHTSELQSQSNLVCRLLLEKKKKKLKEGSRSLKGDEDEHIITAADLRDLPQVFYVGEHGLVMVVTDCPKKIVNTTDDVAT